VVVADDPEHIRVAVDAQGAGHLVVADALQAGWEATLDGEPVPLVNADHGMVAVAVPAGSHTVDLTYQPEGRRAGLALSLAGVVSLLAVWVVGGRWRSASWNPGPGEAAGSMARRSRPGTPREQNPPPS
jgi:uncharacterized membrane protein YfhO